MANSAVYLSALVAIVMIAGSEGILCRKNEIWSDCPSSCPVTCDNPKPADACIQVCKEPGCVCKKGFISNGTDCVRPQDCKRCPKNEVWSDCPSSCPETCEKSSTDACIQVCRKARCVCKKGYVLKNGKCVLKENCNPKCPKNQVWSKCPSSCPKTCDNPKSDGACIQLCQPAGCVCKKGYILKGKECVPEKDCKA